MSEIGIRLAGLGGQGIVLSSVILGRAASVYDQLYAVQTQTYGSDMRGGDVCAEVIISKEKILYPTVNNPDILIAVAQKAFDQHIGDLKEEGILITDETLVAAGCISKNIKHFKGSFNDISVNVFQDIRVANMIMLGFLQKKTDIISLEALQKAVEDSISPSVLNLNLKALQSGQEIE
ncbi:MAG: 2-oxoacid:acceptor oxidoreductase family protein [Caldisericia bacterium]|nr:2-oxoacid:acceptor oxidoreductase family protein [Caldisericia bacterium]